VDAVTLFSLRRSALALAVAVTGWATGCAITPHPVVDPGYAARAYTPLRVTVLPPDVFVVVDQVGDNDPAQSAALAQQVSTEMGKVADQVLRARGYDADFSVGWDGVRGQDGTTLVSREDLGGLANGVLAFANSQDAATEGALATPRVVAPELASRVGWATQSDAVLYLNVKGAVVTPGKRTASILAGVFFVAIVAVVIIALAASSKGGGSSGGSNGFRGSGAPGGSSVGRAAGGGWRGTPTTSPRGIPIATPRAAPVYRGGGAAPVRAVGAPVYVGGGPHVGIGVGVVVPLNGPVYTHDGTVDYDDPLFAGDQLYVSMTLVSTYDGRVLWHARDSVDLEADRPDHIEQMMHAFLETLPAALPRAPAKP